MPGFVDNQRMNSAPRLCNEMRQLALEALCESNPDEKVALAFVLHTQLTTFNIAPSISPKPCTRLPGRPAQPALTHPAKVPRRSPLTLDGRAAMVHAICHIEFNAIKTVYNESTHKNSWTRCPKRTATFDFPARNKN